MSEILNRLVNLLYFVVSFPVGFTVIFIAVAVVFCFFHNSKVRRKEKYLKKNGFKRRVFNTPIYGNNVSYCWENEEKDIRITESYLHNGDVSYKDFVKKVSNMRRGALL